jgi:selenide,water dikinase
LLLSDAQTSGGLLVAMPATDAESYLKDLHQNGFSDACLIGEFTENGRGEIRVL